MYSTNDIKLILEEKVLTNGEGWVNIREPNPEKIKKIIEDKQELTIQEILNLVRIEEEDILNIENINLKILDNNISEREAIRQKEVIRKDIFHIYVKNKYRTNLFTIVRMQDFLRRRIF